MSISTALNLDAIGEMYTGHHPWLVAWLRRRLGCPNNAADLAHDTFTRVISRRDSLYAQEARALLTTIAKGLPAKVRQAFMLSQLDGLTYPQIAEELGVSLSSVQQYMTRAYAACLSARSES